MTHIRQRRDTSANWAAANPVLRLGEVGWDTDERLAKLGNGVTPWNTLDWLPAGPEGPEGPQGPPNTLSVGSVTTGAPGSNVAFQIVGASPNQTVNVTIPRGDKGEQGIQGIQGIQGPIGPANLTMRGPWSATTDYVDTDAVTHDGSSWYAYGDPPTGEEPSASSANWIPLALMGQQGIQGEQGIQGIQGEKGDTGETPSLRGVSTSSVAIGTGSKTFAISPSMNVAFPVGATVKAQGAAAGNYMVGVVTASATNSVTINVTEVAGSGTFASWTLTIGSYRGADGTGQVNTVNGSAPVSGNVEVRRLIPVLSTSSAGSGGANYWVKIATYTGNVTSSDVAHTVRIEYGAGTNAMSATVAVRVRTGPTLNSGTVETISVLSMDGPFTLSNFKLVKSQTSDGTTPNFWELWVQTPIAWSMFFVYELSRSSGLGITYSADGVAFQSTIGTGAQTVATAAPIIESALPARLSTTYAQVTDWNNATTPGWYLGLDAANAPASNYVFGLVFGIINSANVIQEVYRYNATAATHERYRRIKASNVWGAWERDYSGTETNPALLGGYNIRANGSFQSGDLTNWSAIGLGAGRSATIVGNTGPAGTNVARIVRTDTSQPIQVIGSENIVVPNGSTAYATMWVRHNTAGQGGVAIDIGGGQDGARLYSNPAIVGMWQQVRVKRTATADSTWNVRFFLDTATAVDATGVDVTMVSYQIGGWTGYSPSPSDSVMLYGNQTIAGTKTFSSGVRGLTPRFGLGASLGDAPLVSSAAEFDITAKSMVTIGETVAGSAHPAITWFRTASGARSGRAWRWALTGSQNPFKLQYSNNGDVAYGSETWVDALGVTQNGQFQYPSGTTQEFYNTTDQTTNYERVRAYWTGNVFYFNTEVGGTGVARDFNIGTPTKKFTIVETANANGSFQFGLNSGSAGIVAVRMAPTLGASSGTQTDLEVAPTINQSGTAGYSALKVNVTETAVGSGGKTLLWLGTGGTGKFWVDNAGSSGTTGSYTQTGATAGTGALAFYVGGDATARLAVNSNGGFAWGPGTGGQDTNLYRNSAGLLRSDHDFMARSVSAATPSATSGAFGAYVPGDTASRWSARTDGQFSWGPGNATQDTNLYRAAAGALKTDGTFSATRFFATAAAGVSGLGIATTGDTQNRFEVTTGGIVSWGPGNAALDTNLYRSGVNALTTDGAFGAGGGIFDTGQRVYSPNNIPSLTTLGAASRTGGGREAVAALSATTGTATGDLNVASIFTVTPTGTITIAFSNVPASGTACTTTVIVSQTSTVRTVNYPAGTKWMGAAAPTQMPSKVCAITFVTVDGGTTWYASAAVEA